MHLFWSDNDDNVKDNDYNENDEKDDEKKMRKKKGLVTIYFQMHLP